ncbi:MAG TPA: universal stress protein [Burkholderiales bacterium]
MFKNILIPTDGSPLSLKAALNGVKLAQALGAKIVAFYAAPPATPVEYKGVFPVRIMTPEQHKKIIEKAAVKYLGAIEGAAAKAGVPCTLMCVTNDFPAEAILAAAKRRKCDLIYMGAHGKRGLSGMLLGSQTQKVLANAKIPVVVDRG